MYITGITLQYVWKPNSANGRVEIKQWFKLKFRLVHSHMENFFTVNWLVYSHMVNFVRVHWLVHSNIENSVKAHWLLTSNSNMENSSSVTVNEMFLLFCDSVEVVSICKRTKWSCICHLSNVPFAQEEEARWGNRLVRGVKVNFVN